MARAPGIFYLDQIVVEVIRLNGYHHKLCHFLAQAPSGSAWLSPGAAMASKANNSFFMTRLFSKGF